MSLQGKTTMLDDFELGGQDEMEPTSSMTFSTLLRVPDIAYCRTGEYLYL